MSRDSHPGTLPPRPATRPGPSGFALPAAILALVAVGLVVTGVIQLVLRPQPVTMSAQRSTQAFYVAESGMNAILANWRPEANELRVWGPPETRRGTTGDGEWEAEIRRIGDHLYFIRATGRVEEGSRGPSAKRAVGVVARGQPIDLDPPAALQTMGPVFLTAPARIRGEDHVPAQWGRALCPHAPKDAPAVMTPAGVRVEGLGAAREKPVALGVHSSDSGLSVAAFDHFGELTWSQLTALASVHLPGGIIDLVGPKMSGSECDVADPMNWGDPESPAGPCGDHFPIIHLRGDATIRSTGSGQGILLAEGDLDFEGEFRFFGLVIAQGSIDLEGGPVDGPSVFGAMSAKNPLRAPQRFAGAVVLRNSSCAVRRAVVSNEALTRLRPLPQRSWVDLTGAAL